MMKDFFSTKIGHQTIAFIVTLFPFLFSILEGNQHITSVLTIGIVLMLSSMLAVPVISFAHGKKITKEDVKKEEC